MHVGVPACLRVLSAFCWVVVLLIVVSVFWPRKYFTEQTSLYSDEVPLKGLATDL